MTALKCGTGNVEDTVFLNVEQETQKTLFFIGLRN